MTMSSDERKIAKACFFGGMVCVGTLLLVYLSGSHPWFYGAGVLAGFLAGYLAFEFEEVIAAISIAARYAASGSSFARREVPRVFVSFWRRPLLVEVVLPIAVMIAGLGVYTLLYGAISPDEFLGYAISWFPLLVTGVVLFPAFFGECDDFGEVRYGFLFKGQVKGAKILLRLAILFVIRYFWVWLVLAIWCIIKFPFQFSWYLFKLIHSEKRVSCGAYSTVGGTVTFVLGSHIPSSPVEYGVLIFTGGCIGAVLGVMVGWKLISVKCFDMPEHNPV